MSKHRPIDLVLGLALLLASGAPALADVIDGDWCHDDGRRLSIKGAMIVTPGGARLQGDYTRHSFQYLSPATEPDGGRTVSMILLSETRVEIRRDRVDGAEVWHRCTAATT
jgi:hypothetical protein